MRLTNFSENRFRILQNRFQARLKVKTSGKYYDQSFNFRYNLELFVSTLSSVNRTSWKLLRGEVRMLSDLRVLFFGGRLGKSFLKPRRNLATNLEPIYWRASRKMIENRENSSNFPRVGSVWKSIMLGWLSRGLSVHKDKFSCLSGWGIKI